MFLLLFILFKKTFCNRIFIYENSEFSLNVIENIFEQKFLYFIVYWETVII